MSSVVCELYIGHTSMVFTYASSTASDLCTLLLPTVYVSLYELFVSRWNRRTLIGYRSKDFLPSENFLAEGKLIVSEASIACVVSQHCQVRGYWFFQTLPCIEPSVEFLASLEANNHHFLFCLLQY